MKISVVTICYNSKLFIEKTILSVINQSYEDLEYIVVDGGSTDGTLDVIHKYSNRITKWISEKDEGIYNAMNKALDIITGDWVIFMNSGDCFYRYDVLSNIDFLKYSEASCCGVIYGNGISLYRKKDYCALGLCHSLKIIKYLRIWDFVIKMYLLNHLWRNLCVLGKILSYVQIMICCGGCIKKDTE